MPPISAVSGIVLDRDTGAVLGVKNPDARRGMASTTKMMTALIAIERNGNSLDTVYTVSSYAAALGGTTMNLNPGDRVSLRDLIYGLMLPSGNDAALAIAEAVAGSEGAFVNLMNQRAQALGLSNTLYRNPHGLDPSEYGASCDASLPNCGHFSTARDLAKLARFALNTQPFFAQVVRTVNWRPTYWVSSGGVTRTDTLVNDNRLLSSLLYQGANGVKTGRTPSAGNCLVASATRSGESIISVVMGCASDDIRHTESAVLLDFGFARLGTAQVFANGSFENNYANWTWSGNQEVIPFGTTDGAKAIRFNAGQMPPNGILSQSFVTTPGQPYTLSFDFGAYSPLGLKEQRLAVNVRGTQVLVSQVLSSWANGASIAYAAKTFSFVADASVTTLTFQDVSPTSDAVDLYLDDVRIVAGGTVVTAPVITTQPQSVTVAAGGNATFSVGASGASLSYQWRFNGVNIAGASASSYTVANAQSSQQGSYSVVVANSAGSVSSAAASLTVTSTSSGGTSGGFVNGSFENDAAGWTVSGNQGIMYGYASDGAKAMRFNVKESTPNGVVSQSFGTTVGYSYTLTFDFGGYSPYSPREQRLAVSVQGSQVLVSQTLSYMADAEVGYVRKSYTFTADQSVTTLTFRDVSLITEAVDLYLDNVRLTSNGPVTSPSPSPGLVNGSFESDYAGWTATGNQGIISFAATDGAKSVRFNAGQTTPNGVLSQTVGTSAGRTYTLTFDFGGYSPFSPKEQRVAVSVRGSQLLLSQTLSYIADAERSYVSRSFTFTADSSSAVITFQDVSETTDAVDLYLDNVDLN